jgi:hypothetical protein
MTVEAHHGLHLILEFHLLQVILLLLGEDQARHLEAALEIWAVEVALEGCYLAHLL